MSSSTRSARPFLRAASFRRVRRARRAGPLARATVIALATSVLVVSPLLWGAWVAGDWTVITIDLPGILALAAIESALVVALALGDQLSEDELQSRLPHTPDFLSGCGPA